MVHKIGKNKLFIAVISHKRPENILKMRNLLELPFSIFVNAGCGREYVEVASVTGCEV